MFDRVPESEGRLFALGPFRPLTVRDLRTPAQKSRQSKKLGFVVVSSLNSRARILRFSMTASELGSLLSKLDETTDDPTIVGQFAGMTHSEEPAFRVIAKADPDPLSDEALVRWINQSARRMNILAAKESAEMVDEMLEWIDFEWSTASGEKWVATRAGIEGVFSTPSAGMIRAQQVSTSKVLQQAIKRMGGAAAKLPGVTGNIASGFRVPDRLAAQGMMRHHGFFVRDQYGRIAPGLAGKVQPIILQGIEQGRGRREISKILSKEISGGLQQKGYWETVAANAMSRSRSFSLASTFKAAGITHYRIEALIDEVTTETCMMLHEMLLPVDAGLANLNRILSPQSTPQDTMQYQPFIRQHDDEFRAEYPDGTSTLVGTREEPGKYTPVPANQMVGAGVGFPPYHQRCRTTVLPEIV